LTFFFFVFNSDFHLLFCLLKCRATDNSTFRASARGADHKDFHGTRTIHPRVTSKRYAMKAALKTAGNAVKEVSKIL